MPGSTVAATTGPGAPSVDFPPGPLGRRLVLRALVRQCITQGTGRCEPHRRAVDTKNAAMLATKNKGHGVDGAADAGLSARTAIEPLAAHPTIPRYIGGRAVNPACTLRVTSSASSSDCPASSAAMARRTTSSGELFGPVAPRAMSVSM